MAKQVVLVAAVTCPNCGEEDQGTWLAPEDGDEDVADDRQLCGSCGHTWIEPWPGYSYRTEAG